MSAFLAPPVRLFHLRWVSALVHLAGVGSFAAVTQGHGVIACSYRPVPWHDWALPPFRASIALAEALPQQLLSLFAWSEIFRGQLPSLVSEWLLVAHIILLNYTLSLLCLSAAESLLQVLAEGATRALRALPNAGCSCRSR